jgi:ankyrin repeat protein
VHRFVELRRIAETICKDGEANMGFEGVIQSLCWLALEHVAKSPAPRSVTGAESNASLLSAAAYLGCFSIARKLLLEGNSPTRVDNLFPCAVQAAALAGNVEMLQFLQEALQEAGANDDDHGYRWHPSLGYVSLGGKGESEAMVGAAMRGDIKMLHLALHPATSYAAASPRPTPSTPSDPGQPARRVSRGGSANPAHAVLAAMQHARTLDVYTHLASFFPDFLKQYPEQAGRHLELYAEYGNTPIVRHLLEAGVPVGGSRAPFHPTPLHHAARRSYADIVHLLLDRGADVRKYCRQLGDPLFAAVDGGDLAIVQALLDKGAVCNYSTLQQAVFSERTDLIDLMMRYCTLLEWHMPKILDSARRAGLYSMVEYVEGRSRS